jgi:hypothetical protein
MDIIPTLNNSILLQPITGPVCSTTFGCAGPTIGIIIALICIAVILYLLLARENIIDMLPTIECIKDEGDEKQ